MLIFMSVQEALHSSFYIPDQQRPILLFQVLEKFIEVGVLLQALQFHPRLAARPAAEPRQALFHTRHYFSSLSREMMQNDNPIGKSLDRYMHEK
ncbi:MAG TPA: hypothetical protein VFZ14_09180 [Burkholderiales bacterium]|nr:hypothetical protein [Burkholderiales bacterium]